MTRTRALVLSALAVVGLGLAIAVGLALLEPASAAIGPLPAEALVLPADTRLLAGLDVRRLVSSPLYPLVAGEARLRELEERTGLRPDRDVDRIVVAAGRRLDGEGLILALGRFERTRLAQAVESRSQGKVTRKQQDGTTVYLFAAGDAATWHGALAFLDDRSFLLGSVAAVEKGVAARARGGQPLLANAALTELLGRVRRDAAFWMVTDKEMLAALAALASSARGGSLPVTLPTLSSLVLSGDVDPELRLELSAEATDEPSARTVADMLRGVAGLVTLAAAQKPELKDLAAAFSVTNEGRRVQVAARIPHAVIEAAWHSRPAASAQTEGSDR